MKYKPQIVTAFFKECGIPEPQYEYKFHNERRWKFDLAWPEQKLYLEVDGGIFVYGRHNRGAQMLKDWEKRNAASQLGWRGLWFQPQDLCLTDTTKIIKTCLNGYGQFL